MSDLSDRHSQQPVARDGTRIVAQGGHEIAGHWKGNRRWAHRTLLQIAMTQPRKKQKRHDGQVLSLKAAASRAPRLASTHAYKNLLQKFRSEPIDDVLRYVRGVGIDWMRKNGEGEMWDSMTFRELALQMSGTPSQSYGEYLNALSTDREWVDASMLHALCCHYKVDGLLVQPGMDPTLLGPSLRESSDIVGTVVLALVNDHHFWGTTPVEPEKALGDMTTEKGDWTKLPHIAFRKGGEASHEARSLVLPASSVAYNPRRMLEEEIEAELAFCQTLTLWRPWETPSSDMLAALSRVAGNADAVRCELRAQVIEELAFEAEARSPFDVTLYTLIIMWSHIVLKRPASRAHARRAGRISPASGHVVLNVFDFLKPWWMSNRIRET